MLFRSVVLSTVLLGSVVLSACTTTPYANEKGEVLGTSTCVGLPCLIKAAAGDRMGEKESGVPSVTFGGDGKPLPKYHAATDEEIAAWKKKQAELKNQINALPVTKPDASQ